MKKKKYSDRVPVGKKTKNYINNEDLMKAIINHQTLCKKHKKEERTPPTPSDYIGKCILDICNRLSTRYNFINYSYRDMMVGEATERCIKAINNFDIKKSNKAFTYLTYVAFHAMQHVINIEKHQNYIKHKHSMTVTSRENPDGLPHDTARNEVSDRIIAEYEEKMLTKANKSATLPKKVKEKKVSTNV